MRHASLEGEATTFKSIAISKIAYLALFTMSLKILSKNQNKIQKKLLWSNILKIKIKHGTMGNDYKNGGLKNVDIELKIVLLKGSWICRLYNEFHYDWKIIPLNYINNALGKKFKFYSNSSIPNKTIQSLPSD